MESQKPQNLAELFQYMIKFLREEIKKRLFSPLTRILFLIGILFLAIVCVEIVVWLIKGNYIFHYHFFGDSGYSYLYQRDALVSRIFFIIPAVGCLLCLTFSLFFNATIQPVINWVKNGNKT